MTVMVEGESWSHEVDPVEIIQKPEKSVNKF
jgi:hypothetical protein